MNNALRTIFGSVLLAIAIPLGLWLILGASVSEQQYLDLARSGLLLVGLFSMVIGVVIRRVDLITLGLCLILLGWLSFHFVNMIDHIRSGW